MCCCLARAAWSSNSVLRAGGGATWIPRSPTPLRLPSQSGRRPSYSWCAQPPALLQPAIQDHGTCSMQPARGWQVSPITFAADRVVLAHACCASPVAAGTPAGPPPPPPCPRTHGCLRGVYCCMCVVHVQWATVKACRSGPVPVPDHILCCHATHPQAQSALGNKWTDIARLVNGRSNSAVKNHWNVQSKELFACGTLNNRWAVLCPPTFLRQPPLLLLSCVCQHSTSMPGASDDVSHFRYKGVVCFTRWSGWTTHGRCWRWCWC
jgi:hypothetical protein